MGRGAERPLQGKAFGRDMASPRYAFGTIFLRNDMRLSARIGTAALFYPSGRMQTMSLMMRFCALGVLMIPPFQYICAEAPPSRL